MTWVLLAAALGFSTPSAFTQVQTQQADSVKEFAGLWEAKLRFGPDVRGPLFIRQSNGEYRAEIAGLVVQATVDASSISFKLPDGRGEFQGEIETRGRNIAGYWIQEKSIESGLRYASPVTLTKYGANEWRGNVSPLDSTHTLYLMIKAREDGSFGVFVRNPERNLGWTRLRADRIEREKDIVRLVTESKDNQKGKVVAEGRYNPEDEQLSFHFRTAGARSISAESLANNLVISTRVVVRA